MKISKCKFCLIILFLTVLLVNSDMNINEISQNHNSLFQKRINLNSSGFWNLTSIFIDDTNPTADWAYTKSNYDWCTGLGTKSNPYVIENVTIDGLYTGSCIRIINSDTEYFTIKNCTISNSGFDISYGGIKFENTNNGIITSNNFTGCTYSINLQNSCEFNYISNNNITGGGIELYNGCNNNTIYNNNLESGGKISIYSCIENNITKNIVKNSGQCIYISHSSNNTIDHNEVIGVNYGIQIQDSTSQYNIISNNIVSNFTDEGISIIADNNIVINNTISNCEYGILGAGDYCSYINNTMKHNTKDGFINSIHNTNSYNIIANNTSKFNDFNGFMFKDEQNSNIIGNNAFSNSRGIQIEEGVNISIVNNSFRNNYRGLVLTENSNNNKIIKNYFDNNSYGIQLSGGSLGSVTQLNIIEENIIVNISGVGIVLSPYADSNNISQNRMHFNYQPISTSSGNNLIFDNDIRSNTMPAYDNTGNNNWNNSVIGNYWDEYVGKDSNDDGIGDNPFSIAGSGGAYDYKPIFWDPIDFDISTPLNGQNYGKVAPNYSISLIEGVFDSILYSLESRENITTLEQSGKINQSIWDILNDGNVSIRFYLNDSKGIVVSRDTNVIKDTLAPDIKILTPQFDQLCGINSPEFSITVNETYLLETWYSLNGGDNVTFTSENKISQTEWNKVTNGTVIIKFFAKDQAGNVNFTEIAVEKDGYNPIINILSPNPYQRFGEQPPTFNISIVEVSQYSLWYTISSVGSQFSFTELEVTINQATWDSLSEGEITITFYSEDEAGNIGSNQIIVIKDLPSPEPPASIPGFDLIYIVGLSCALGVILAFYNRSRIKIVK